MTRVKINKSKSYSEKREARNEMRALRREARQREDTVLSEILRSRDVILSTNVGASTSLLRLLPSDHFDLVIIDEAAQALEISCWIPMLRGSGKVVLAVSLYMFY